ncbi:MAG: hypothetical protein HY929_06840 [Euryarchaeota archaeon]|nr:hypothetical protein [Euryarchaeota archaeon]
MPKKGPWHRKKYLRVAIFDGYFYRLVRSTTDKAVEFYIKLSQDGENRRKYYAQAGKEIELVKDENGQITLDGFNN